MSAVTTAMTAILKQFQATPPPASVKAVEKICVTCGGAHLGLVLDGPTVPSPPPFINPEVDQRIEETLTDPDLSEYTIKVPPPFVQKYKPPSQRDYVVHQRDPLHQNIPYPSRMLKQKQQEKDKVQIHKFWQMFKQLHINITLADALILMPKVPLILGRPFLQTARALIDVHGEEMILRDEGGNVLPEKLLDLDSTKDLHPPLHVNPLSGSTTYSSSPNQLLEELVDELALIKFLLKYDDDLQFDVESDLKEIEFLLHQDIDSSLKDSIDQSQSLITVTKNHLFTMNINQSTSGLETLVIQMSTTASNTNFLNGFNGSWRWGCLKLFENSRHGGSYSTHLLIECMAAFKESWSAGFKHSRKYPVGAIQ
nr:hypothetical protein [Tanacetum cinerariifolium]